MASRRPPRRKKNQVIDYTSNLLPNGAVVPPKRKRRNANPAVTDAVLNVGLPGASSQSNASSVSLPLPRSGRRTPQPSGSASRSTVSLAVPPSPERPRQAPALVRQQSNQSARSLAHDAEQINHAQAEIQAAMTRHDVYQGLDVQIEAEPPPVFSPGRPPTPPPQVWPCPETPPPDYRSDADSDSGSIHDPLFPLPRSFDPRSLGERAEDEASRAWLADVAAGLPLDERITRDQARRAEIDRQERAKSKGKTPSRVPLQDQEREAARPPGRSALCDASTPQTRPLQPLMPRSEPVQEPAIPPTGTSNMPPSRLKHSQAPSDGQERVESKHKGASGAPLEEAPLPGLQSTLAAPLPAQPQPAPEVAPISLPTPEPLEPLLPRPRPVQEQRAPSDLETDSLEAAAPDALPLDSSSPFTSRPFGSRNSLKRSSKVFTGRPPSLKRLSQQQWVPVTLSMAPPSPDAQASHPLPEVSEEATIEPLVPTRDPVPATRPDSAAPATPLAPKRPLPATPTQPRPQVSISQFATALAEVSRPVASRGRRRNSSSSSEEDLTPVRAPISNTGSSVPAVTLWDGPSNEPTALPKINAVQHWEEPREHRYNRYSSIEPSSESDQNRREEGRRHSALLVRPLSVKRKPPVPTPRRWATAIHRASMDQPFLPSVVEGQDAAPRSPPERPVSSILSYIPPAEASALPEPLKPSDTRLTHWGPTEVTPLPPPRPRVEFRPTPSTSQEPYSPNRAPDPPLGAVRIPRRLPQPPVSAGQRPQFLDAHSQLQRHEKRQARFFPPSPNPSDATAASTSTSSDDGRFAPPVMARTPSPAPLLGVVDESAPTPTVELASVREAEDQDRPLVDVPPANRPQRQRSMWYTDFDALLNRINSNDAGDGTNYDDLLLVSEVLGTAKPAPVTQQERDLDQVLVAPIELESRRVDKNGKTKSKYSCGGIRVNKCAICLTQFRPRNMGSIFPGCLHVFHAECMRKWLLHSRNCPACRRPLPDSVGLADEGRV